MPLRSIGRARALMSIVLPLALGLMGPHRALAQGSCPDPAWHPFDPSLKGFPGVQGFVFSTTLWDPDGPGPLAQRLVVGGSYSLIGDTKANSIASLDLATNQWSPMGTGVIAAGGVGSVDALTTLPNGSGGEDLIVGGEFYSAGGQQIIRLARWDGQAWSAIGGGVESPYLEALTTLPDGAGGTNLIVGGSFKLLSGVTVNSIARWDGIAFHPLGQGLNGPVYALRTVPGGAVDTLIAAGNFTTAGGLPAASIARWDGENWHALANGIVGTVASLATMADGAGGLDLIAGGFFTQAGGAPANSIARWDGASWTQLGDGITSFGGVNSLAAFPDGLGGVELIAGGTFSAAGGVPAFSIARWDGSAWSPLGTGMSDKDDVKTLAVVPSVGGGVYLYAGGEFSLAGGVSVASLARWDGAKWSGINGGMTGYVAAMTRWPSGMGKENFIIGGVFQGLGGVPAQGIARWDGGAWSALGSGIHGEGGVLALTTLPHGAGGTDLIAGGTFAQMGGVPAARIARWDGTTWSPLGSGLDGHVRALATIPDGAGGEALVVSGDFTTAGGQAAKRIARWDGMAWSPVGGDMVSTNSSGIYALATLPGAAGATDLIVGGFFDLSGSVPASAIARWDGLQWHALGSGLEGANSTAGVMALATMPGAAGGVELFAGGYFYKAGGVFAANVARWDGSEWFALGNGVGGPKFPTVNALITHPRASGGFDLIAGGYFFFPGSHVARWNGTSWAGLGSGVSTLSLYQSVLALASLPRAGGGADVIVGGSFERAGGIVAPRLARYGCPAPPPCTADCDGNAQLTIDDFICFQTNFVLGVPAADCDGNGSLSIDDFICFQTFFVLGC